MAMLEPSETGCGSSRLRRAGPGAWRAALWRRPAPLLERPASETKTKKKSKKNADGSSETETKTDK
jgi:hypothetical protein